MSLKDCLTFLLPKNDKKSLGDDKIFHSRTEKGHPLSRMKEEIATFMLHPHGSYLFQCTVIHI